MHKSLGISVFRKCYKNILVSIIIHLKAMYIERKFLSENKCTSISIKYIFVCQFYFYLNYLKVYKDGAATCTTITEKV